MPALTDHRRLDEMDREDFFRLKKVQSMSNSSVVPSLMIPRRQEKA